MHKPAELLAGAITAALICADEALSVSAQLFEGAVLHCRARSISTRLVVANPSMCNDRQLFNRCLFLRQHAVAKARRKLSMIFFSHRLLIRPATCTASAAGHGRQDGKRDTQTESKGARVRGGEPPGPQGSPGSMGLFRNLPRC